MPLEIPLRGDLPFFDLQVPLDDVTYTLEFRWNERASSWFYSISDETGEIPYHEGLRVVVTWAQVAYSADRHPAGILVFIDTESFSRDIERMEELGGRVKLWYYTVEELGL